MNRLKFVGIGDQAVGARPPPPADRTRLTGAHFSAVDPNLLERVRGIFNDPRLISSRRQAAESSLTPRLQNSMQQEKRLPNPASFARGNLSDFRNFVVGQGQVRNPSYNSRPGEKLPAVDTVKPDPVADKPLDGWLPAPSGLRRRGTTEVQNLPPALNEREGETTSKDLALKNLFQARFDVGGRERRPDQIAQNPITTQGYNDRSFPAVDKSLCSVSSSYGHWSDALRLPLKKADETCSSNATRGGLPVNRSLPTKHYSQVSKGNDISISVRQQPGSDVRPSNSTCRTEISSSTWKPLPPAGYDSVLRSVGQGETSTAANLSVAGKWQDLHSSVASVAANSDVVVARRIFQDYKYKGIEFETYGQTVMVLKMASEETGLSGHDALGLKDSLEKGGNSRSVSHETIVPNVLNNRSDMSYYQSSNRERADPTKKVSSVDIHERSRVEFGDELMRRAQKTDSQKVKDDNKSMSESQSVRPVYMDYNHGSRKQEPSNAERKLPAVRDWYQTTDSSKLKDRSNAASANESTRKSEDRSRSKKAITDEFLRTRFLLEIGRREKELRRIADISSASPSGFGVLQPLASLKLSDLNVDHERDAMKPVEPRSEAKGYDSSVYSVKPSSSSISSSRMLQDFPPPPPRREVTTERSRKVDETRSRAVDDFRRPLSPAKTGYRNTEPPTVSVKPHYVESSSDAKREISSSQSYRRDTRDPPAHSQHLSGSSASRGLSTSYGNQSSTSISDKTNREREVRDGFRNEERVTFWENIKAHLDELYAKKSSPLKSQLQGSEDKRDLRSKDSYQVNEGGKASKQERTPTKDKTEQSKYHVKMEHTPTKEKMEQSIYYIRREQHTPTKEKMEQTKYHAKREHTQAKEKIEKGSNKEVRGESHARVEPAPKRAKTEEQRKLEVKTKPEREQSYSRGDEAKRTNVGTLDRLPVETKRTARPDQSKSLNRDQKIINKEDKAEKNVASKQKAPLRPRAPVRKTDFEQKTRLPESEEKRTADKKQNPKGKNIINKRETGRDISKSVAGTNRNVGNSSSPRLNTKEQVDIELKGAQTHGSDDLRNLLKSKKLTERGIIWHRRKIVRERDETSVVLKDDTDGDSDELVIEVPGPGKRQRERDDGSVEVASGGREQRNSRVSQGSDAELGIPRKRFKFNETAPAVQIRRSGFWTNLRKPFGLRSIGRFQRPYSAAVGFDEYRRETDSGADIEDRGRYMNPDEKEYVHMNDKNRVSDDTRNRYRGQSNDRYSAVGSTKERYRDEVPHDLRRGGSVDLYPGDADDRFSKKEFYNAGYPDVDGNVRDREDCDNRFSENYDQRRFRSRHRSATRYLDDEHSHSGARYSNEGSEARHCGNRGTRGDDERERYRTLPYGNDEMERSYAEDISSASSEEFGERGSYDDRRTEYPRAPNRARFDRTVTFDKLKGPRAFLEELEQNCVDYHAEEERPCDIEVTVESDRYNDDDYTWDEADAGFQEEGEEAVSDVDFDKGRDELDFGAVPRPSDQPPHHRGARFGGRARGRSFQTRSWRGKFFPRSTRGNSLQTRLGYRRGFGFQSRWKKFLPTPLKFQRRLFDPEFIAQPEENISEPSNSMQEAIKQVMSNLREAEMTDPEADAALFDTLSRGEKKQVIEIQQMTGIQCITAIVTALRTLWEFEPKVVRTLGNLEPEEIKQLGDDDDDLS